MSEIRPASSSSATEATCDHVLAVLASLSLNPNATSPGVQTTFNKVSELTSGFSESDKTKIQEDALSRLGWFQALGDLD